MSLKSVAKKIGKIALDATPIMKNTDLKKVHSKSILGRMMRMERPDDEDGLIKSTIKGMLGGAYETASDNSLLGRIRNRNIEEEYIDDDYEDTDDSNSRPVLASIKDTSKRVASPTLSVISRQLQDVVNRVLTIGKHLKKQQDIMVDQAKQQEHINKENIMEANRKLLPNAANDDDAVLISAFNSLSDRISNIASSMEGGILDGILSRLTGGFDVKGMFSKGGKATKLKKGFTAVQTATGMRYRNVATGRFVKAAEAVRKPGVIGRVTGRVGTVLSTASKAAAATKMGGLVARAGGKVATAVTPALVKKIALPLALKAVGKTVLKSIPVIGAIAGIGFAAKRLLEGDVVGAGLEAVSGLAGPLTAIPALIASLARDLYAEVFGIHPESDPLVGKRMATVTMGVKQAVEQAITPNIKPQQSAAGDNAKALAMPKPIKPPANDNQKIKPQAIPMAPAKVAPVAQTKPKAAPISTTPPPKAPPASPQVKAPPAVSSAPLPSASKPATSGAALAAAAPPAQVKAPSDSGKKIAQASMVNDALTMPSPPSDSALNIAMPLPAKVPTTMPASQGIGNVPDPTYFDIDSFAQQMYFGAAA